MPPRVAALLLALVTAVGVAVAAQGLPGPARRAAEEAEAEDEARQVDLLMASQFHDRLEAFCDVSGVRVQYRGTLGRRLGGAGIQPEKSAKVALTWDVFHQYTNERAGPTLFRIHASVRRGEDTFASCRVGGKRLYLRLSDIRGGRTADDPLPDLRGEKGERMSVRALFKTVRELSVEPEKPREE